MSRHDSRGCRHKNEDKRRIRTENGEVNVLNDRAALVDLQVGDLAAVQTLVGQLQTADLQTGLALVR